MALLKQEKGRLVMKFFHSVAFAAAIAITGSVSNAQDDAGLNKDYRTFHSDGKVEYGEIGDSYDSDLVMYLAGNQFMVMEELIQDFQSLNSDIETIYVETIPPGQILNGQILQQGQINDQDTAMNPDLYASVNLNHLKKLAGMEKMNDYMIYMLICVEN
jgi:hypothetical protein